MEETIEKALAERLKRYVKAELKRADVGYEELATRLSKMGLKETKATIGNKVNRGAFSAIFLVALLKAIGRDSINLNDL
jgi:hypothetical protein